MTETLNPEELLRLRMIAQGLTGPGAFPEAGDGDPRPRATRIADTARRMLAVQGQDWRSARFALGVRTPGTTVDDVHDAFNEGAIVRSWPMRGTIHVVAAEDIGWMQSVTSHRVLAGAAKRREFLGISDAMLDRLVETALEALRDGASLDRDELAAAWSEAGLETQSNWRYHLIWWLCQNGLAVQGPVVNGGEPRLVSAPEWIPRPRELHGDEALAELAARYASSRGAVSAKDLAWWTGLTAGESKRGLAHAGEAGRLVRVEASAGQKAVELWADPASLDLLNTEARAPGWQLLPAFDEHLLGYRDRAAQLAPEHFERIVPGRNGMFLATVLRRGRVVGTWKRGTRKGEGILGTPLPGERLDPGLRELRRRARDWAAFHGLGDTSFSVATG